MTSILTLTWRLYINVATFSNSAWIDTFPFPFPFQAAGAASLVISALCFAFLFGCGADNLWIRP
ncbi:hypothetical protein [Methylorubrum sp. SL192]|uniref:hypothetical protein n=1 Tax=Methylorubrum sp. SL192 TaxID=2995167 RepID=UPI0022731483|nr:hypothetical protein [Methylorubrum sp. SL192]MCY1643267.1 hypothetical protein [Methylorubrum sp. SL192]